MGLIADMLPHRCDLIAYRVSNDAEFGKVNSEVVVLGGVACWFQPRSAVKRTTMSQFTMEVSHVVLFDGPIPTNIDVQNKLAWRAVDGSGNTSGKDRYFEIAGIRSPAELGEFFAIGANEFDPYAAT